MSSIEHDDNGSRTNLDGGGILQIKKVVKHQRNQQKQTFGTKESRTNLRMRETPSVSRMKGIEDRSISLNMYTPEGNNSRMAGLAGNNKSTNRSKIGGNHRQTKTENFDILHLTDRTAMKTL